MKPVVWALRSGWLALPLVTGPAFEDALAGASTSVRVTCGVGLWLGWALVLVAVLVPRTSSLTVVRIAAPAAAAAAAAAASTGGVEGADVLAASWTVLVSAIVFWPDTGAAFVNGSSYGDEVRVPLRAPGHLLLGPVELAWAVTVAGVVAGPLLLAARAYVAGAIALVGGAVATRVAARALHTLSRRWIVVVPAGLVVHDPLTLADPVLLRRSAVEQVGPAPASALQDGATDLTANALGLALEARLREPVELALLRPRRLPETVTTRRVVFTPTRPGALLSLLSRR